jgi:peptidoglycan/LPS O-acetylase OafA/YrhL
VVYLFCWLIGAYAYVRRPETPRMKVLLISVAVISFAVIAIQVGKESISLQVAGYRKYVPGLSVSRILLASGMAVLLQQAVLWTPRSHWAVRLDATGRKLGAFSYTLYLTHYPILQFVSRFTGRAARIDAVSLTLSLATVITCLVGAWILYWLFESRTQWLRTLLKTWLLKTGSPACPDDSGHEETKPDSLRVSVVTEGCQRNTQGPVQC